MDERAVVEAKRNIPVRATQRQYDDETKRTGQSNVRRTCRDCEGATSAEVTKLDCPSCEQCAWYTDDTHDDLLKLGGECVTRDATEDKIPTLR